jgi:RNA polymerase sigma-70 factor (ECF subfamily)
MQQGEADEALMAQTALGDQRALRILMARHMGRTIRIAETVLGSAFDADDVAQEAFVRVWSRATSFDPTVARFTTWLYRIAINLAIDRARHPANVPIEVAERIATDEPNALADLIAREDRAAIAKYISQLPDRQRVALALFHFEGLSGRDAAEAMQMTEKAFESLLIRARASLKQRVLGAQSRSGGRDP